MVDLLLFLIGLVFLPYEIWKLTTKNSGVGVSGKHRENERFWWRIGMVGAAVVLMISLWAWRKWG